MPDAGSQRDRMCPLGRAAGVAPAWLGQVKLPQVCSARGARGHWASLRGTPSPTSSSPLGWPTVLETKQTQMGSSQQSPSQLPIRASLDSPSSQCRSGHRAVARLGSGKAGQWQGCPGDRAGSPQPPEAAEPSQRRPWGTRLSQHPHGRAPSGQRSRDTYRKCREKLRSFPICQGAAGTKGRCFRSSCS